MKNSYSSGKEILNNYFQIIFQVISFLIFIIAFSCFIYFQIKKNICCDFDSAGELILGNLLSKEHSIITKNFYYPTEFRIFSHNITNAFFFLFFKNWQNVLAATNITWMSLLLVSYYFLCRSLNITKYFLITACLFLIPYTPDYMIDVICYPYYIPPIFYAFLSFALIIEFSNADTKLKKFFIYLFLLIIPFINAITGFRSFTLTYSPIFLCALYYIYKKQKQFVIPCIIEFVSSIIALYANKILYEKLLFSWSVYELSWADGFTDVFINNIKRLINSILIGFGYYTDNIFSFGSVNNIIALFFICSFTIYSYKKLKQQNFNDKSYLLILLISFSFFIFSFITIFSNLDTEPRYIYPVVCFAVPIFCTFMYNSEGKLKYLFALLIVVLLANNINKYFIDYYGVDEQISIQQMQFKDFLLKNEYYSGYASINNSNRLTFLTNNEIQMYNIDYNISNEIDYVDDLIKHYQLVSHTKELPKGKVFLLLTKEEFYTIPFFKKAKKYKILESDLYIVLGFKNFDEMVKATK